MAVAGKGKDVKPWRLLCSGAASDLEPKLAVVLVHMVKSSPVDLTLRFMLPGLPFV